MARAAKKRIILKNMGDLSIFAVHVKMAGGQGMSPCAT